MQCAHADSMVISARICAAGMVALVAWWWPQTVYVWTRSDGDVFRVRFTIDANQKIIVLEDYTKSPRSTALASPARALSVRDYFRPCHVFDARNFVCSSSTPEDSIE